MSSAPRQLIEVCQAIGRRVPGWTQGAGGNVSYKVSGTLWIKASGARLDGVSEASGLAKAELAPLRADLRRISGTSADGEARYSEALKRHSQQGQGLGRLSMEAGFHALLERPWVIHFHSLAAVLMAELARTLPEQWASWLSFAVGGTGLKVDVLHPTIPGLLLSEQVIARGDADIYLLANHGVILHSENEAILEQWSALEREFARETELAGLVSLLNAHEREEPWDWTLRIYDRVVDRLRIYFPDTAVFLDRLNAVLEPAPGGVKLAAGAQARDRDAAELWLATLILHDLAPELPELAPEICSKISSLPVEQWRRAMMAREKS